MDQNSSAADDSGHIKPGAVTTIADLYTSPEQTESFPLKHPLYRKHKTMNWGCHICSEGEDNGGSLRIIVVCFITLTIAVAVALATQIRYGGYQLTPHGSVATDSLECSAVGTDILKKGGNAVDAAVAATLCMGVINFHVTGLGGGGFAIVYDHRKRTVLDVIDFRETAPSALSGSMLVSESGNSGLFVGVPGLLRGLGVMHSKYGLLPWSEVVLPSVGIARSGFSIPTSLTSARSRIDYQRNDTMKLADFLKNIEAGGNLTLPNLAATLQLIAANGPDEMYVGHLANAVLSAVQEAGGVMENKDLNFYQPKKRRALHAEFGNFNVIVADSPSGGPFILETLRKLDESKIVGNFTEMIHTLATAMREAYKKQFMSLGEPVENSTLYAVQNVTPFWNYPEATGSHVAAVDLNDVYVSIVSGLNTWFGSQLLTNEGFLLNNAMKNFNDGSNSFAPGKRPFSLGTPIIALQKEEICGRRLVSGVGDAVIGVQLLTEYLKREKNISTGMEAPRFRYNPVLNQIQYEAWHKPEFSNKTLSQLQLLSYKVTPIRGPYQSSNLIEKIGDNLSSRSDSRGGGVASRF